MARSLASLIYKGRAAFPAGISRFSTTVPNDSDTDEDFRPNTEVGSSGLSLKDLVEQDVKENPVMIYMKGIPNQPPCGFSALAMKFFREYTKVMLLVTLGSRNILEHEELKNAVRYSSMGSFLGGSDVILSMHKNGELKDKPKDVVGKQQ